MDFSTNYFTVKVMSVHPLPPLNPPWDSSQGCSRWSGWSGFGRTTISQGKNKIPLYRKQVINKNTRVIFGLVQLVILQYSR